VPNAAVAFGLTIAIVGIVGAPGAGTAVCAKAGNAAANKIVIIVFFIFIAPVY
jgi:hypothetical protein